METAAASSSSSPAAAAAVTEVLTAAAAVTRAANGVADRSFAGAYEDWSAATAAAADAADDALRRLVGGAGAGADGADDVECVEDAVDSLLADADAILGPAAPAARVPPREKRPRGGRSDEAKKTQRHRPKNMAEAGLRRDLEDAAAAAACDLADDGRRKSDRSRRPPTPRGRPPRHS